MNFNFSDAFSSDDDNVIEQYTRNETNLIECYGSATQYYYRPVTLTELTEITSERRYFCTHNDRSKIEKCLALKFNYQPGVKLSVRNLDDIRTLLPLVSFWVADQKISQNYNISNNTSVTVVVNLLTFDRDPNTGKLRKIQPEMTKKNSKSSIHDRNLDKIAQYKYKLKSRHDMVCADCGLNLVRISRLGLLKYQGDAHHPKLVGGVSIHKKFKPSVIRKQQEQFQSAESILDEMRTIDMCRNCHGNSHADDRKDMSLNDIEYINGDVKLPLLWTDEIFFNQSFSEMERGLLHGKMSIAQTFKNETGLNFNFTNFINTMK